MKDKRVSLERIYQLWGWILLAWSLYRYFFVLPETLDEFLFKPLLFLAPVFYFVRFVEKRPWSSIGLHAQNLFRNIYIGIGFGLLFAVEGIAANFIKYGRIQLQPIAAFTQYGLLLMIALSFATALSEEILNRGFLFNRIAEKKRSVAYAAVISTLLFVLLHVSILVTSLKLQGTALVIFFATDVIIGLTNSLLYYNTGSLVTPVLVHAFWNMAVAMYL